MNIRRELFVLVAVLMLPGLAMAGSTQPVFFNVEFDFNDSNPNVGVTAQIKCDEGLPLENEQVLYSGEEVTFVVETFDGHTIDCRVWVTEVADYTSDHYCGENWCDDYQVSDNNPGGPGCFYDQTSQNDHNNCDITMEPDDAFMTITKTWDTTGNNGSANFDIIDFGAQIIVCTGNPNVIEGDVYWPQFGKYCRSKVVTGPSDDFFDVTFDGTGWDGDTVYVYEWSFDSSVEVDVTDCVASPGNNGVTTGGASYTVFNGGVTKKCTITNTIFYEGIPTLNQYGLAIMVLLMLGVGFVGFRRFV